MGTKNNPAPNDCYDRAEPDEPMFTLLARDPVAAHMVSIWSALRAQDFQKAQVVFNDLMLKLDRVPSPEIDMDKVTEAMECSAAMFTWIKANRPERALNK